MQLPTEIENPDGLHQKYIVTKADGTPIDPHAVYFVLRLDDFARDTQHIAACHAAAREYIEFVRQKDLKHLNKLADDLEKLIDSQ